MNRINNKLLELITALLFLTGAFSLIFGIFIFSWGELDSMSTDFKINSEKIGQIGDFIGGVSGSIWALAGVILFYLALKEQRKDLKINHDTLKQQIKEFKLQTQELEETRLVFKEQSETIKIQRFENTFFKLIQLHHEIIDKLSIEIDDSVFANHSDINKYKGKEVITRGMKLLRKCINDVLIENEIDEFGETQYYDINVLNLEQGYDLLNSAYHDFYYRKTKQNLSNYFRSVYHIFKFIYTSELIKKDKKQFYASILRAQLSSEELFLIFYNSLIPELGKPKFLYLIKEFDILQNFDFSLISKYNFHQEIYDFEITNVDIEVK